MEASDRWSIQDKFVLTINLTVFCCDFLKIFYNVGPNESYEKCVFEIGKSVYRRNFILSLVSLTVTWPFLKPILRNCYWVIFKLANTSILTLVWGKCFTYRMCWEYRNFEPTTIQVTTWYVVFESSRVWCRNAVSSQGGCCQKHFVYSQPETPFLKTKSLGLCMHNDFILVALQMSVPNETSLKVAILEMYL